MSAVSPEPLISLRGVRRQFRIGTAWVRALDDVSFDIARGEYVSIIGPSGSGKSTLLQILGCLDTPSSGSYRLSGEETSRLGDADLARVRNQSIGFVFQAFHLIPRTTVLENVSLPLSYRACPPAERERLSLEALERTRMSHRHDHWPSQLSGGERQRVAIARAIVTRPPLLLCDEPTGNLDQRVSFEITRTFELLHEKLGMTLVVVTHDPAMARRASRTIRVVDGRVVYDGAPDGWEVS